MERLIEFAGNHLYLVSLFIAILSLLVWHLFGSTLSSIKQIDSAEVTRLMNREHAVIVDIRNEEDYKTGHILNAVNFPETTFSERQKEFEKFKTKPVVIYCADGRNSARAAKVLKTMGIEELSCLKNGFSNWQNAGLPVARN